MRTIYTLKDDLPYIASLQRASLSSTDVGLQAGPHGLVASATWWRALDEGKLPVFVLQGTVVRLEGDRPAIHPMIWFHVSDSEGVTCWEIKGDEKDYTLGMKCAISYVVEKRRGKLQPSDDQAAKLIIRVAAQEQDGARQNFLGEFNDSIQAQFEQHLVKVGFHYVLHVIKEDACFCERVYRRGNQYIAFIAYVHPKDYPEYWSVILGEGNNVYPESAWNSVAMEWYVGTKGRNLAERFSLAGANFSKFPEDLLVVRNEFWNSVTDFLQGELTRFYYVRSELNKAKAPHTMYVPDENGNYALRVDRKAEALRQRFG